MSVIPVGTRVLTNSGSEYGKGANKVTTIAQHYHVGGGVHYILKDLAGHWTDSWFTVLEPETDDLDTLRKEIDRLRGLGYDVDCTVAKKTSL